MEFKGPSGFELSTPAMPPSTKEDFYSTRMSFPIMEFMLNGLVNFNDNTRLLCRGVQSIELSVSSARLLTRLLLTPNELVRRDDLLSDVWDKFNLTPSDSNLNKNISLIRRAFLELKISNSIETLPKQGFMLRMTVLAVNCDLPEAPLSAKKSEGNISVRKVNYRCILMIVTSISLIFLLCTYIFYPVNAKRDFSFFGKVELCEVYIPVSAKRKSIESFIISSAGKNSMSRCENMHKIVYIDDSKLNVESFKKETFVAVCDINRFGGRNECKNYVFL